jgi:hypothetical protein
LAEETFTSAYVDKDWSKRYGDWWNRFKKAKKIYEVTGKSFKGFRLTVPRTTISGQPTVSEWVLIFSEGDG